MGIGSESAILNQLKKAQGETNERLEAIAEAIKEQNRLLADALRRVTA